MCKYYMTHKLIKGGVLDLGLKKKNQEFCLGPKNVFSKNNWGQNIFFFLVQKELFFKQKFVAKHFFVQQYLESKKSRVETSCGVKDFQLFKKF